MHSFQRLTGLVERAKEQNNGKMFPALINNAVAGYKAPVKTELLKGAGLLSQCRLSLKLDEVLEDVNSL